MDHVAAKNLAGHILMLRISPFPAAGGKLTRQQAAEIRLLLCGPQPGQQRILFLAGKFPGHKAAALVLLAALDCLGGAALFKFIDVLQGGRGRLCAPSPAPVRATMVR